MDKNTRQCSACFQRASGVVGHASVSQAAAVRLFSDLMQSGHFPVMCQKDTGRFHVCHEQTESARTGFGANVRLSA